MGENLEILSTDDLRMIDFLRSRRNILIPNPEEFQKKLSLISEGGADNLHLVTDFDETITRSNGSTSWSRFKKLDYFSGTGYPDLRDKLYAEYHPIETNPLIVVDVKRLKMKEWWENHLQLLVDYKMSKNLIDEILNKGWSQIRSGFGDLFKRLDAMRVPILVLSSGIGDIIEGVLRKDGLNLSNIHIVSNYFEFDENGLAIGFKKHPIIHSHNKDEVSLNETPYADIPKQRQNLILLGNNDGDMRMSDGIEYGTVIKIFFANDIYHQSPQSEEEMAQNQVTIKNLEYASKLADVVVVGDPGVEELINVVFDRVA